MSVIARTATRYCLTCNQAFVPFNGSMYCSRRCQKRMNNLLRADKVRAQAQPLAPTTCPTCGEQFVPRRPNAMYCSPDCQKRGIHQRQNERRRAERASQPAAVRVKAPSPVRVCVTCGTELAPGGRARYCGSSCWPQARRQWPERVDWSQPKQIAKPKGEPRACVECGVEFMPNRTDGNRGRYCSLKCRNESRRMTVARQPMKRTVKRDTEQANERAALSRSLQTKAGQFTDAGFHAALARERWLLDNEDQHPDDKHWRRKEASDGQ
jgi:hypothetical protein